MSYHFIIFAPPALRSTPQFQHEFGTARSGGDGQPRFSDAARALNPLVAHAALDLVDDARWATGNPYLRAVDRFQNAVLFAYVTPADARFVLLACAEASAGNAAAAASAGAGAGKGGREQRGLSGASATFSAYAYPAPSSGAGAAVGASGAAGGVAGSSASGAGSVSAQYGSAATGAAAVPASEEAVRSFFADVYDAWVKAVMSPFHRPGMAVGSPVFRQRVQAAAKKYL